MNKYKKELTKEEILIFESINKIELLKLGYKLENHEANNNQSIFEKNLIQKQKNILKFN